MPVMTPSTNQILADQIGVTAIGVSGRATQLFGQMPYDRKVWLYAPAPGVFISHNPINRTVSGFELPATTVVQFDLPAQCQMYALAAAGTIQVSRYSSTVMPTVGTMLQHALELLLARFK